MRIFRLPLLFAQRILIAMKILPLDDSHLWYRLDDDGPFLGLPQPGAAVSRPDDPLDPQFPQGCRFIDGDPADPGWGYCRRPIHRRSLCRAHFERCYLPPDDRRLTELWAMARQAGALD